MAHLLKLSGASDTASEHRVFFWARLKLTSIYIGILAVILLGFSLLLYQNIARNLNEANDDDFAGPQFHHRFVQNTLGNVEKEIIIIDLIILAAAAGVSYVFAGYTLRPIQNSLEARKKFSENASHELRTPLAVMKNDIEVLLRNPSPTKDAVQSTLKSSVEEIDRLSGMARDLLTLARAGTHAAPIMEHIDTQAVLKKTAKKMRTAAKEKGIHLDVKADEPLYIEGHAASLERIILNLLQNAIDHTPKEGSISIQLERVGKQAVISITDTGSGIGAKDLPHIFDRFYKGERSPGTGLGLAIVKELTEQQQGAVSIASVSGKGTTARLRFPLA